MKIWLLFSLFINFLHAQDELPECYHAISKHIKEAIHHNSEVLPYYNNLSSGRSEIISRSLIGLEYYSILQVKKVEEEALTYQQNGIAILCDEIADMKDLAPFRNNFLENVAVKKFQSFSVSDLVDSLKLSINNDDFNSAYETIQNKLTQLEKSPHQLCLSRHLLESLARTIILADNHRLQAMNKNLPDPKELIKKFLLLQLRGLRFTYQLDREAFPMNLEGIPLFCQDVPVIEWKKSN
jgi:hypothetical protein